MKEKTEYLYIIIFLCFGHLVVVTCSTLANSKAEELHAFLTNATNQDIPPCIGCGAPLQINISFHLVSLNDLDEVRGEMNSIGYLTVSWVDDRIAWNPMDYAGIGTLMLPSDKIWTPLLLVGNPSKKISTMNSDIIHARVLYNGTIIWNPGDVFVTKCYPDIYRYPYDAQECYISVVPWGATFTEIVLKCPLGIVVTSYYENNGEWVLMEDQTRAVAYFDDGMSVAKFIFRYQRRPQFFVVNVILPIVLLSYLNCLVYIIPMESGERVSYSITVLLSFAVFMTLVSDNIPKTSAPMSLLCYYLISIFGGSTLVMISTIYNMSIFYRDPNLPVTAPYRIMVKVATKQPFNKNKVHPDATSNTQITVFDIEQTNTDTDKCNNDPSKDIITEKVNQLGEEEEIQADLTWKDVTKALDTISLFGFLFYFTASTVVQLLFISIPSSSSVL